VPLQRPDVTDRGLKFQSFFVTLLFPLPLHCVRLQRPTKTPSALHFDIACTSDSVIHVQRSQLRTCHNGVTATAGYKVPLQRPDVTDRWLKFQSFFVTLLFPLPLHCVRHQRPTTTLSALHFVIVCTSDSIIHVQRSQLRTCHNSTTATAGSRLPLQRPDPTDRWLKFQSFFVTLLFPIPLHCVRL